jgi:hypothetical protein
MWLYCSKLVLSAAILKVHTEEVAELVLVATHAEYRNKVGMNLHCIVHSELSVFWCSRSNFPYPNRVCGLCDEMKL